MKKFKTLLSLTLLCALVFNLTACSVRVKAADLMQGVTANKIEPTSDLKSGNIAATSFAVSAFKQLIDEKDNTLISPLSLMLALSMTANGADGETKAQMETALGMDCESLNEYFYSYVNSLPQEKKQQLYIANSIWFKDSSDFTANQSFLQTNADYYGAGAFKGAFDETTADDINNWVAQNTDNMIKDIVDEIPRRAIMYLVNALSFEAEWSDPYKKSQVYGGIFKNADGKASDVDFMHQTLWGYLECENASGFIKPYKDGNFAFAALLPDENTSVSQLVSSLDGEKLNSILNSVQDVSVETEMPKFEAEYNAEMSGALKKIGIQTAFDEDKADFKNIGTARDNIFINRVLHKTYISVAEKGTRAGAATVIEMADKSSMPSDTKTVILNRPFVYMIIDCQNNVPIFIGALNQID